MIFARTYIVKILWQIILSEFNNFDNLEFFIFK